MMVATAAVLALVIVVAAASAGSVLLAAGRAQDAADAAALAAADARHAAVSPIAAAATAAAAHGGTLTACDCAAPVVTVTVGVRVSARPARLLGVTAQHASARATHTRVTRTRAAQPGRAELAHRAVRSAHDPVVGGNARPT